MKAEPPTPSLKKREQLNIRPSEQAYEYFLRREARILQQLQEEEPDWKKKFRISVKHPDTFEILMQECEEVENLGGLEKIRKAIKEQEETK